MAAVCWPALVSVAGGGRVEESAEVVREVWTGTYPICSRLWWDRVLVVRAPPDKVHGVFRKCPSRVFLCAPAVVQAFWPSRAPAETRGSFR